MAWKPPQYCTLGFVLLVRDDETGGVIPMSFVVEEVPEEGIDKALEGLIAGLATRGVHPLTQEQYAQFSIGLAAREQENRLHAAMSKHAWGKALSDAECDSILRAHTGTPQ